MTGPKEPWGDPVEPSEQEWDFPELTPPDPTSVALPEPEPEPVFDTGSDGWWRAQAKAQREAAGTEHIDDQPPPPLFRPMPPIAPLELIEPSVLNDPAFLPSGPSPLDEAYLPPEEVFPPAATPPAAEPVAEPLVEPVEEWLAVTGVEDTGVEAYPEPVAEEPVDQPIVAAEAAAPPPPPMPPLMRPLVVPEPTDDWYDAPPAPPEDGDGGGVGFTRALAWAGLALAGVGLLVVAFLLLGKDEPKGSPTVAAPSNVATSVPTPTPTEVAPSAEPTAQPTVTPSVSAVPAATPALGPIVPLTVLNNSRISHLAERAAARFRAGGWPVPATGNYRGKLETTTIYYPPGQRASALRFGRHFGVRVLPRFATLPGSGMTVVVTRDFA